MAAGIEEIVTVEGPVHIDLILQRVRDAWNIGRVGPKIRENIDSAIAHANVIRDGAFINIPNRTVTCGRVPAGGVQRTAEQVADDELALALVNLVRGGGTVNQDDLTTATARIYGWNRRGSEITARLTRVIDQLIAVGTLVGDTQGHLSTSELPID